MHDLFTNFFFFFRAKFSLPPKKTCFCLLSGFVPCQSAVELTMVPPCTVVLACIPVSHNYKQVRKQQGLAPQVSK